MSKPVKDMIIAEYRKRFTGVTGAVVVEVRGLDAAANNRMRNRFREGGVRVTVLKNDLARKAFAGGPLASLDPALAGPNALVYSDRSVVDVARELVKFATEVKEMELKAACLDGIFFEGKAGVERLSKFPTREEAQAKVVTLVLSPARKVVGCVVSPGSRILGIVKAVESRLEKGEAIAKIA
jgi:large subunit ribosomal protein L10